MAGHHQAIGNEGLDRLCDGGRAHVVGLGQPCHGRKLVPGLKLPRLDLPAQECGEPLAGSFDGARHMIMIPGSPDQVTVFILFGHI